MILPAENCRFAMLQGDMTYHVRWWWVVGSVAYKGVVSNVFFFLFYFFLSFFGEIFMGFFLMNLCFFSNTMIVMGFRYSKLWWQQRERGLYIIWRVRLVFKLISIKLMRKFTFYFSFILFCSSSDFLFFFVSQNFSQFMMGKT